MQKLLFLVLLALFTQFAQAQAPRGALWVMYEGDGQGPGRFQSIGYPCLRSDSIDALAAQGFNMPVTMLVYDSLAWISDGQGNLVLYNLWNRVRLRTIPNVYARGLALYDDGGKRLLLAACSQKPYFKTINLATFAPAYNLDSSKVTHQAEAVVVVGNKAAVTVNGFGSVGKLVVIDLSVQDTVKTIDTYLNPNAALMLGNRLYLQCLGVFSQGLVIQSVDTSTWTLSDSLMTGITSYGGFTTDGNHLYFNNNTFGADGVSRWAPANPGVLDTLFARGSFYALNHHAGSLWASKTDYATYGIVGRIVNGQFTDSLKVNEVSPRALHFTPSVLPAMHTTASDTMPTGTTQLTFWSDGSRGDDHFWFATVTKGPGQVTLLPGTGVDSQRVDISYPTGQGPQPTVIQVRMQHVDHWGQCVTDQMKEIVVRGTPMGMDARLHSSLRVYPNPSAGLLYVQLDGDASLVLVDAQGRQLEPKAHATTSGYQLDISALADGVYTLRAQTAQGWALARVQVQH